MKAVMFDGVNSVKVGEVSKPVLLTNKDALVKITHASICGTDLNILNGKIPVEANAIMGHEGVGVVEEAGSGVSRVKRGDRVVISYSIQCGECQTAEMGSSYSVITVECSGTEPSLEAMGEPRPNI